MEAIERIKRAIEGQEQKNSVVQMDRDGKPVVGIRTPIAGVIAGDVVAVVNSIKDPDPIAKMLRQGASAVPGDRVVYQQVQDLVHMLGQIQE